ncbi:phosphate ABC transporter substrate-binding protein PstS [Bifidobacterium sp. ESL0728]|uniref:phosphate ABC transporter substrate-binding protein PstS n=1 Tax=Bifidobacterium sp. ESL0728 TaxID=2983220 RepID=UPI0023F67277|nr:phosphate ABC transporter substrate-binding protein PstS [Bifidobacterium sp. ESL0728]WEV59917.1 phosphate ABC transporter substrate-binding protein PstS [Bifidobacterium sp. ESL0728]
MHSTTCKRLIAVVSSFAMMAALSACGDNTSPIDSSNATKGKDSGISGEFHGAGASSQQGAVEAWIATYQNHNRNAKIAYNPSGSGAGVSTFLTGAIAWAGTDAPLNEAQIEQSKAICESGSAFDVPVYVSPIAVMFNLKGISGQGKHLNMDASVIARIFDGKITQWNDDAIKAENPKVNLPATPITVVHRSDKSGTTNNFTSYLKAAAPNDWSYEAQENWPNEVGQAAKGTDGVVSSIGQADGTVGYADLAKAGNFGTVSVKVGTDYVAPVADAAAKTVNASPLQQMPKGSKRVVVNVDYATSVAGDYPIVSSSYAVACPAYKDRKTGVFVRDWLGYVLSDSGQKVAADNTGSAALGGTLTKKALKSVNGIQTK